ncbi:MAG TPA: UDP-N-acetylglucosamine 2-epimerase (non-hydrolyzing) [Bryobacteraceae bacterium]|jgi:UDP-N-acetylglucosamine 2-epimerase (non-hydrolysing)|nr:UDP-N-acetylglucosamine 2-epimerase (non-hydrolyzing) [Bryobacteraceae bacterium]
MELITRLAVLAGARPNFMKVAPLMAAIATDPAFETILIHTGQHYDDSMSGSFLRDLQIPHPRHHLQVGSGSHAQQTAEIMRRLEPVLLSENPDGVIVVGDVNSTVAGALVASKLGLPVIHAEAGLRSFDRTMPEEINRIVTDAISDLLLVTEESGRKNLLLEGKSQGQIEFVGNLMVDSLRRHLEDALKTDVLARLAIAPGPFGLVTLHRPANVDDESKLAEIAEALRVISADLTLYWPVHPRTRARLESIAAKLPPAIHLLDPLGYFDFLHLQAKAAAILTDSGGIQEESTVLGVPCLTIRENTERPATIEYGTNRLAGTSRDSILKTWQEIRQSPKSGSIPPLWDGQAGVRCHAAIQRFYASRRCRKI